MHSAASWPASAGGRGTDLLFPHRDARQAVLDRRDAADEDRIDADEPGGGRRLRRVEHLLRGAALNDPPLVQQHRLVRERERVGAVMAHDVGRDAQRANQRPQLLAQLVTGRAVERGERLVQQEQPGAPEHGARQGHALLLSSGELARQATLETAQLKYVDQFRDPQSRGASRQAARGKRDVPLDRQVWKQRVVLEEHTDIAAIGCEVRSARRVKPDAIAKAHVTSLWPLETGEAPQYGGLARSGGPQKSRDSRLPYGILPTALDAWTFRIPEPDIHV